MHVVNVLSIIFAASAVVGGIIYIMTVPPLEEIVPGIRCALAGVLVTGILSLMMFTEEVIQG